MKALRSSANSRQTSPYARTKIVVHEGTGLRACRAAATAAILNVRAIGTEGTRRACVSISIDIFRAAESDSRTPLGTCDILRDPRPDRDRRSQGSDIACLALVGQG